MKNNDSRINGMGYLNFEQSHIRMGQNSDHHKPVFDLMLLKQNPPAPILPFFMAQFYHLFMAAIKYYSPVIKRFFSWKITHLWLIFPATKFHLEWISMDFQLPCLITGGFFKHPCAEQRAARMFHRSLRRHGGDARESQ